MLSSDFTVTCGPGVADVLDEVDRMVAAAYQWIGSDECRTVYGGMSRPLWNELHDDVVAMEISFLRRFKKLVLLGANSGEVRLVWDSERSLTAYEPRTGLTVGLIYFPKIIDGVTTPIGEWTLNS